MDKDHLRLVSAIALNAIFGNEPRIAARIVETFGSAEEIFSLTEQERTEIFGPWSKFSSRLGPASLDAAHKEFLDLSARGINFISIFDTDAYPPLLRECPDAPLLLYVRGDPSVLLNRHPVSIVGTRDMDSYGRDWCVKAVRTLSEAPDKPLIVSGLAFGVDITAHLAALSCGLPTAAVIPVGIERIYPASHSVAAGKIIAAGGAVITDYPPGTVPLPYNFLRRNRIIAGLSAATLLVESRRKGGGMMTARLASGYGRTVQALPGRVDDPRSAGCNALIAEKVAEAFTGPEALSEACGLGRPASRPVPKAEDALRERFSGRLSDNQIQSLTRVFTTIREHRGIRPDQLAGTLDMDYSAASRAICLLESEGFICTDVLQRCSTNVNFA